MENKSSKKQILDIEVGKAFMASHDVLNVKQYSEKVRLSYQACINRITRNKELPAVEYIVFVGGIYLLLITPGVLFPRLDQLPKPGNPEMVKRVVANSRPKRFWIDVYLDGEFIECTPSYMSAVSAKAYWPQHNKGREFGKITCKYALERKNK